jgi:biotin transport system substrate-specific component
MQDRRDKKKQPRAISPTPLRDWVLRQTPARRAGLVGLFALLIGAGGKAGAVFAISPVPATQQLLFVMLAGALLGSRLGAVSALVYLVAAAATDLLWPIGFGSGALTGPLAGYLWSLPIAAFLSGWVVERLREEKPVYFAMGVSAGVAAFDMLGSARMLFSLEMDAPEAVARGAAFFFGQHFAQGALAVLIASSASSTLQAREKK